MSEIPRRVIHIPRKFTEFGWGGVETVVLELAKCQKERGLSPEIVTTQALDDRESGSYDGISVNRFNYIYPSVKLSLKKTERRKLDFEGGQPLSLGLLHYLLRIEDVRIFHTHVSGLLGGIVKTAAGIRRKPVVVTYHGKHNDSSHETSRHRQWQKPLTRILSATSVLRQADWVLCNNKEDMENLESGLGHERISYLPRGINDKKFRSGFSTLFREKYQIPRDEHIILCVGHIHPAKNQMLLMDSFIKLNQINSDSTLVMIGSVEDEPYFNKLRKSAFSGRVGNKVIFIPDMGNDAEDLINAYHAANVCVIPSREERGGLVVLETWAAGKPIITSKGGIFDRTIHEEVNGLIFDSEKGDAAYDLLRKILYLQQNPDYANLLGENGRAEISNNYKWKTIDRELEKIYQMAEDHCHSGRSGFNQKPLVHQFH